jgi:hypothetical protein
MRMDDKRAIKASMELLAIMTGKKDLADCKTLGKAPKKKQQHESKEQEAIFQWSRLQENVHPELKLLFAIPNGGSRHKLEAYSLKRQGVKAGIPDMLLPIARGHYHGLFIELKVGKNKTSDNQDFWINELQKQGYKVNVCYGFEETRETILQYLSLKQNTV